MRTVTPATKAAWLSGDYAGARKAMQRATIVPMDMHVFKYGWRDMYASIMWEQENVPLELPNIKSIRWQRSTETDTGTCTLELYNCEPLPLGVPPERDNELGIPGYYTFNHGATSWGQTRWGQQTNAWQNLIRPDSMIRTFEGYGFDPTAAPEHDPNMYPSGVWRIDDVTYTHDGLITVVCRDLGSLLIDQILYPPVVPFKLYPLSFTKYNWVDNPDTVDSASDSSWIHPGFRTSSNAAWGVSSIAGHDGPDAFDASTDTFWVSVGNSAPNTDFAFEWVEGSFSSSTLHAVNVLPRCGPYRCYLSVYADGAWQGNHVVPYNRNSPAAAQPNGNGADIPFVASFTVDDGTAKKFKLAKPIANATRVRVCFTNLDNFTGIVPGGYPYRAGVANLQVLVGGSSTTVVDGGQHREGNWGDYTDIVKRLLAWGGFYWPRNNAARRKLSDGIDYYDRYTDRGFLDDPLLGLGRVWGDFELTGTATETELNVETWDKKPIMDGINYVKDVVGFIFFIDEEGGAVFRSPNIWAIGNWSSGPGPANARITDQTQMVTIDETTTLIGLSAKLSGRSTREGVFVANVNGQIGSIVDGRFSDTQGPFRSGLRRVGGWTDQNFKSAAECTVMADLIALRQLFTFRTDQVTVAGNPQIQIDDQVRIYESVTNEGYLHYVKGIESQWDLESGKWTYTLDTHWLGDHPYDNWAFDPSQLSPETQTYLATLTAPGA